MQKAGCIVRSGTAYNKSLASFDVLRTADAVVMTNTHHVRFERKLLPFIGSL
jgi:hypothetical protein